MTLQGIARTGLIAAAVLFVGGAALAVWSVGFSRPNIDGVMLSGGFVAIVLSVVISVISARARAAASEMNRKLAKYGCSKCGYQPRSEDLEGAESLPCPRCGTLIYR